MLVKRCAAVVAFALFLTTEWARAVPPPDERWRRARTKHFTIFSNDHPHDIERVALEFERFHAFLLTMERLEDVGAPTTVFLFRDEDTFAPYKKDENGRVLNFIGIFVDTEYAPYIAMTLTASERPFGTVYHEYTHYHTSRKAVPLPLWLSEGIAEYMSTFRSSGEQVEVGFAVEPHVQLLRGKPLMALGELFAIRPDSTAYNEGERQGIFYAQSWALFHYLRHERDDLYEKLPDLVSTLNAGNSVMQAFDIVYGIDYRSVQAGLEQYVRGGNFAYLRYGLEIEVDRDFEIEDIARSELLAALGIYLADTAPWEAESAEAHLRESLQLDAQRPLVHAALAQTLARQERHVEARRHFARAIELAPQDSRTHARYGNHLVQRYLEENKIPREPRALPPELVEARQVLMRALELDSRNGEALVSLGKTYLYDPENTAIGLQTLNVGSSLLPGRMDIPYYQVLLLLRMGQRETADQLAQAILERAREPELHALVRQALESEDTGSIADRYNEAVYLFNQRDYARAVATLEKLLPDVEDRGQRRRMQELLAEAREAQAEQAKIDRHNAHVARYNAAVEKANAGDLSGARSILEALVQEVEDPELERAARDFLEGVRAQQASRARRRE